MWAFGSGSIEVRADFPHGSCNCPAMSAFRPNPSSASAFAERRKRLIKRFSGPAIIASGLPRPRNFRANRYPFRAESHFLYLVGVPLQGAALVIDPGCATLY